MTVNPFQVNEEYFVQLEGLEFDLIIFTHSDLDGFNDKLFEFLDGPMGAKICHGNNGPMGADKSGPMGADKSGSIGADKSGPMGAFKIINDFIWLCSLTCENSELLDHFESVVNNKYLSLIANEPILLQRHKQEVFKLCKLLELYEELSAQEHDISIISSELNNIGHCISELVGIVSPDDVLHNIFDNFCIGK